MTAADVTRSWLCRAGFHRWGESQPHPRHADVGLWLTRCERCGAPLCTSVGPFRGTGRRRASDSVSGSPPMTPVGYDARMTSHPPPTRPTLAPAPPVAEGVGGGREHLALRDESTWLGLVTPWYLADCATCPGDLAEPFRDETERDTWAARHLADTGHAVRLTIDDFDLLPGLHLTGSVQRVSGDYRWSCPADECGRSNGPYGTAGAAIAAWRTHTPAVSRG